MNAQLSFEKLLKFLRLHGGNKPTVRHLQAQSVGELMAL